MEPLGSVGANSKTVELVNGKGRKHIESREGQVREAELIHVATEGGPKFVLQGRIEAVEFRDRE